MEGVWESENDTEGTGFSHPHSYLQLCGDHLLGWPTPTTPTEDAMDWKLYGREFGIAILLGWEALNFSLSKHLVSPLWHR